MSAISLDVFGGKPSAHARCRGCLCLAITAFLFSLTGNAAAGDLGDKIDRPRAAPATAEPANDWRAGGLAFVELPMGIRARVDATYSRHLYSSDSLALPYAHEFGPGIRGDQSLESRIAFSRPIGDGIELEIAWESRNHLAASDPLGFGRQTIGARIRIAP